MIEFGYITLYKKAKHSDDKHYGKGSKTIFLPDPTVKDKYNKFRQYLHTSEDKDTAITESICTQPEPPENEAYTHQCARCHHKHKMSTAINARIQEHLQSNACRKFRRIYKMYPDLKRPLFTDDSLHQFG